MYKAHHVEEGTPVALKVLHPELVTRLDSVARFEREIEVLTRLQHPNVVKVFDCGRLEDGRPYFVMELLTGKSLKDHMQSRGRLSLEESLSLFEPLCSAVSAAHAQGTIHRDIKPSNVFLCDAATGRDDEHRLVLLDFGVAKLLDADVPGLTSSRHLIGTLAFMSPEQILSKTVDARTDVYSLGVLLYHMLTGEPPFGAKTPMALRQMHLYATPRPPSLLAPVSPALDAPVLRALSKEPGERQASVDELLKEILSTRKRQSIDFERPALAIYAEVTVSPEALDDPDEALFSDMESILPRVGAELEPLGFNVALETGSSILLSRPLPEDPTENAESRRSAIEALHALHRAFQSREGRCPEVDLSLCLHVADARMTPDGIVTGGALMKLAAWAPSLKSTRPLVSATARRDLDFEARPLGEAGGEAWFEL